MIVTFCQYLSKPCPRKMFSKCEYSLTALYTAYYFLLSPLCAIFTNTISFMSAISIFLSNCASAYHILL